MHPGPFTRLQKHLHPHEQHCWTKSLLLCATIDAGMRTYLLSSRLCFNHGFVQSRFPLACAWCSRVSLFARRLERSSAFTRNSLPTGIYCPPASAAACTEPCLLSVFALLSSVTQHFGTRLTFARSCSSAAEKPASAAASFACRLLSSSCNFLTSAITYKQCFIDTCSSCLSGRAMAEISELCTFMHLEDRFTSTQDTSPPHMTTTTSPHQL